MYDSQFLQQSAYYIPLAEAAEKNPRRAFGTMGKLQSREAASQVTEMFFKMTRGNEHGITFPAATRIQSYQDSGPSKTLTVSPLKEPVDHRGYTLTHKVAVTALKGSGGRFVAKGDNPVWTPIIESMWTPSGDREFRFDGDSGSMVATLPVAANFPGYMIEAM